MSNFIWYKKFLFHFFILFILIEDCKAQDTIRFEFVNKDTIILLDNFVYRDTIFAQGYNVMNIKRKYLDKKNTISQRLFLNSTDFLGAHFRGTADFSRVTFNEIANFPLTFFYEKADFSYSSFKKEAWFGTAPLIHSAYFDADTFLDKVSFLGGRFVSKLSFKQAHFNQNTRFDFLNTILPDTLDFSDINKIYNDIDLTSANFTDSAHYDYKSDKYFKKHIIRLLNSDISKFNFDYRFFMLDTSKMTNNEKASQYEMLLKNFDSRGFKESYKFLDIQYQKFKHPYTSWINGVWWNFGYNKEYIIYWTIALLALFTFITFRYYICLNNLVYGFKNLPKRNKYSSKGSRFWYAFIYTTSIFLRLTLQIENFKFKSRWGTIYVLFMYTIGIVCIAYIANMVLQK